MKNTFEQLGYNVTKIKFSILSEEKQLFYISNKHMNCLWPVSEKEPLFLDFYKYNRLFSAYYCCFIKAIFKLHLQSHIFKQKTVYVVKNKNNKTNFDFNENWALINSNQLTQNHSFVIAKDQTKTHLIKLLIN
ncbi:MAG: hypothetical protein ABIP51_01165 [Bacteroidia bacterium]